MPTYEYRCNECGHQFEEFQRMSDAPVETCPECEGKVQRLISGGTGLIFKGSGFYITDYGNKNSSPANGPKHKETKESTGKESKPKNDPGSKKDKSPPKSDS